MRARVENIALLVLTLAAAYLLKLHYSTAEVGSLAWILAPTTRLVEWVTGVDFVPEAGVGYLSRETFFVIAKPCAGVNFLIVAWVAPVLAFVASRRSLAGKLGLVAGSAAAAYLAALVANTTRIAIAMALHTGFEPTELLTRERVHRLEGVLVYTVLLCLFFAMARRVMVRRPC